MTYLKANDLLPKTVVIFKEVRQSVAKARSRQRIDNESRKAEEAVNSRKRKLESLEKDINELQSKRAMLEKVENSLERILKLFWRNLLMM